MPSAVAVLVAWTSSDVARFALAAVLLVGTVVLLLMGREVPTVLWTLDGTAIAFYYTVAIGKSVR